MANRRNLFGEAMATVLGCDVFILGGPLEAAGLFVGLLAPQRAVPVFNLTLSYKKIVLTWEKFYDSQSDSVSHDSVRYATGFENSLAPQTTQVYLDGKPQTAQKFLFGLVDGAACAER